jgi:hypothetical protein
MPAGAQRLRHIALWCPMLVGPRCGKQQTQDKKVCIAI